MSFANIIKDLRLKNRMTQEDLADALELTPQAVSRWENGAAFPDCAVIRRLAYLFDVTTDYLLEVDRESSEHEMNRIILKAFTSAPEEGISLLKAALKEHPRSDRLMYPLSSLYCTMYNRNPAENARYLNEARILLEQLYTRSGSASDLVRLLHVLRDSGMTERGEELIKTRDASCGVKEELEIELADGEEKVRLVKRYAYTLLSKLTELARTHGCDENLPEEQRVAILRRFYEAVRTLTAEDSENVAVWNLSLIPFELAKHYGRAGSADEAVHWLEILRRTCDRSYDVPVKLQSPLFCGLELNHRNGWYGEDWMYKALGEAEFDAIREDVRFVEIERELYNCIGEECAAAVRGK